MKDITILAIESSCDETAAAVVRGGREVLSNVIYSQIDLHTVYGGVVPEIASRAHIEKIVQVVEKALRDAGSDLAKPGKDLGCPADKSAMPERSLNLEEGAGSLAGGFSHDTDAIQSSVDSGAIHGIDAVAVTYGPGLVGALLVGVSFAKSLSFAWNLPLIGVNHIKGHVCANYIEHPDLKPPFLCLVASGGHTHLVRVKDYTEYEILGRTRDDAAGEAFDKIARAIGLGYPGGPKVEAAAKEGDPAAFKFPRAHIGHTDDTKYDFSFSGLKSAVLNTINEYKMKGIELSQADVAASFQQAVIDSIKERVLMAVDEFGIDKFAIAGGVASNKTLRAALDKALKGAGAKLICPSPVLCTDNAAMIGAAGYFEYINGRRDGMNLNAVPQLPL